MYIRSICVLLPPPHSLVFHCENSGFYLLYYCEILFPFITSSLTSAPISICPFSHLSPFPSVPSHTRPFFHLSLLTPVLCPIYLFSHLSPLPSVPSPIYPFSHLSPLPSLPPSSTSSIDLNSITHLLDVLEVFFLIIILLLPFILTLHDPVTPLLRKWQTRLSPFS